jgi:hypothetical protein
VTKRELQLFTPPLVFGDSPLPILLRDRDNYCHNSCMSVHPPAVETPQGSADVKTYANSLAEILPAHALVVCAGISGILTMAYPVAAPICSRGEFRNRMIGMGLSLVCILSQCRWYAMSGGEHHKWLQVISKCLTCIFVNFVASFFYLALSNPATLDCYWSYYQYTDTEIRNSAVLLTMFSVVAVTFTVYLRHNVPTAFNYDSDNLVRLVNDSSTRNVANSETEPLQSVQTSYSTNA